MPELLAATKWNFIFFPRNMFIVSRTKIVKAVLRRRFLRLSGGFCLKDFHSKTLDHFIWFWKEPRAPLDINDHGYSRCISGCISCGYITCYACRLVCPRFSNTVDIIMRMSLQHSERAANIGNEYTSTIDYQYLTLWNKRNHRAIC